MKAWEVQGRGIESLELVERPKPEEITDNQILVNIKDQKIVFGNNEIVFDIDQFNKK